MFGFLGFIGAGIFAYNFFKDANINNSYTDMSKDNAKKNGSPIYYDTRGHIYETNTGRRCMRWTDIATGDQLLKDVRTGVILRNLTREENKRKTQESYEKAKAEGLPFYMKWGTNEKAAFRLVYAVDGDRPYMERPSMYFKELGKFAIHYQPVTVDEKETARRNDGITYYKPDLSNDKGDTIVKINEEGFKTIPWREWNRIMWNISPVYPDSYKSWIEETPDFPDLYKDDLYLAYDRKTDEPYAVRLNRATRTGIGEMYKLYPDGKGGYIREKKWHYYEFIHETRICKWD